MGGVVNWTILKKEIEIHLLEPNDFVSTLIDYYGLNNKLNFPKWSESEALIDKKERMDFLEDTMKEDIILKFQHKFVPYLQLHEFEGLLFNDSQVFYDQISKYELVGINELKSIFLNYDNPEMINNNRETSPSHRIKRIIKGYNKVLHGHYLAEAIGLEKLRAKSPRFNQWIEKISR